MTRDASDLAAIEEARRLHAVFLDQLGKLDLPLASFEPVRDRLHDNIEDLAFDARRIYDRAPRRDPVAAPWRDDPPAVRAFDREVASAKASLWQLVDRMKGAAE
jgi:hypothetical protein